MRTSVWTFVLLCALLATDTVQADVSVKTEVAVAHVENQHPSGCKIPRVDVRTCVASAHWSDSPGNSTIDTYQRIEYVGIATDFSALKGPLGGLWLLPDAMVYIDASDLVVPHPAFRVVTETWENHSVKPHPDYYPELTPEHVVVWTNRPSPSNPAGPWRPEPYGVAYGEDVQYGQFGPFNTPEGTHTDNLILAYDIWCNWKRDETCYEIANFTINTTKKNTPDVWFGLEFYDVEVATDPGNLTYFNFSYRNGTLALFGSSEAPPEFNSTSWPEIQNLQLFRALEASPPHAPLPPTLSATASKPPPPPQNPPPLVPPVSLIGPVAAIVAVAFVALLAGALYSRFHSKADLLRSETRIRLLELVQASPGMTLAEAGRALGVTRNAVLYQVRMLAPTGELQVRKEPRGKCLYPKQGGLPPLPNWLLYNPVAFAIVSALQAAPNGLLRDEIHGVLAEIPKRTRNYHLRRLLDAGFVKATQDAPEGKTRLHIASPA